MTWLAGLLHACRHQQILPSTAVMRHITYTYCAQIEDMGHLTFYLAPKIDDDEVDDGAGAGMDE